MKVLGLITKDTYTYRIYINISYTYILDIHIYKFNNTHIFSVYCLF